LIVCSVEPAARQVRPQPERYTACTFRLVENILSGFALATMETDRTRAYNQDDATGLFALSLRLNESRHSLDATPLRLKVAAKVHGKNPK
jgi:hypothetical protein